MFEHKEVFKYQVLSRWAIDFKNNKSPSLLSDGGTIGHDTYEKALEQAKEKVANNERDSLCIVEVKSIVHAKKEPIPVEVEDVI